MFLLLDVCKSQSETFALLCHQYLFRKSYLKRHESAEINTIQSFPLMWLKSIDMFVGMSKFTGCDGNGKRNRPMQIGKKRLQQCKRQCLWLAITICKFERISLWKRIGTIKSKGFACLLDYYRCLTGVHPLNYVFSRFSLHRRSICFGISVFSGVVFCSWSVLSLCFMLIYWRRNLIRNSSKCLSSPHHFHLFDLWKMIFIHHQTSQFLRQK